MADTKAPPASAPKLSRLLALVWSGVEAGARQFVTLGLSFALLSLMTPHDLGVFALSYALNQIPSVLLDEPIIEALVQRADLADRDWNTGFTLNLLLSAAAVLLSLAAGGVLARLLGEPALVWSVPGVTTTTLLGSLGNVQKGHLARDLRFRAVAKGMLLTQVVAGLCGLAVGALGYGYWALIANLAVFGAFSSALWWRLCPWSARFALDPETIRWITFYGTRSAALRCVLLIRDNAPVIFLGSFFGTVETGYFSLAFRIARTLGLFFEDLTRMPMLAVMSREQHDEAAAGALLSNIMIVLGAAALPAFVGLILVGPYVPVLISGPIWAPSGHLVPWLCIVVGGWLMLHIPSVALRARGRVSLAFWVMAPPIALDFLVLIALAPFGLTWALIGMSARAVLAVPFLGWVMQRWLGVSPLPLLRRLMLPIAGAGLIACSVIWVERHEGFGWGGLGIACLVGALTYAVVVGGGSLTVDRSILVAVRQIK